VAGSVLFEDGWQLTVFRDFTFLAAGPAAAPYELQRDWARKETVPQFIDLFIDIGGTAGIQFAYDRGEKAG